MRSLCKHTKSMLEDNRDAFVRILPKRNLKCHYPLFERVATTLEKHFRWDLFNLDIQIKFIDDFKQLNTFIESHPTVTFKRLHLVITEESLQDANKTIDLLRSTNKLPVEVDESYKFLLSSNYCRASSMTSSLRYETELIIGAEPSAFIDKVESVYLLDVRAVSKCPVENIEFSAYKIRADVEFCTQLEAGNKVIGKGLIESVKKITKQNILYNFYCIIEDEVAKVSGSIDNFYAVLSNSFSKLSTLELELTGGELKKDQLMDIFSNSNISRVKYEGLDSDSTIKIEAKKIPFRVMSSSATSNLIGEDLVLEFEEKDYRVTEDFIIISPSNCNIKVKNLAHGKSSDLYSKFDSSSLEDVSFVIHQKYVNTLALGDVPTILPKVIPSSFLRLYISEKENYSILNQYLDNISDTLPIFAELDLSFLDNLEATKEVISNLFTRNIIKLDIVMEMQEDEFITHLYSKIKESKTIRSVTAIINQDPSYVIDLINSAPQVEQWILDVRKPWEEKEADLIELLRSERTNTLVIRDVYESLIEYRYQTSFEIRPII